MKRIFESRTANIERLRQMEKAVGITGHGRVTMEEALLRRVATHISYDDWQQLVYDAFITTLCKCTMGESGECLAMCRPCQKLTAFLAEQTTPDPERAASSRARRGRRALPPVLEIKKGEPK